MEAVKAKVLLLGMSRPIGSQDENQNPEKIVACAGKLCYAKSNITDLYDGLTESKVTSFVEMLANMGHESPIEHISFTFGIEGISRACSHQLVRHRLASYSQQSQRYVDLGNTFNYIIPPEIASNPEAKAIFEKSVMNDYQNYVAIVEAKLKEYTAGITDKKIISKLTKKALEDARFALPNACETKIIMTMNARELMNFFAKRCCNRAQWEIREVADQMLDLCLQECPHIFKNAGAQCVYGHCPEGQMSCGHPLEPRPIQLTLHKEEK